MYSRTDLCGGRLETAVPTAIKLFAVGTKLKRALLKSLVPDRKSIGIPVEDLELVAIAEHEKMGRKLIFFQQRSHHPTASIKATTRIGWLSYRLAQ